MRRLKGILLGLVCMILFPFSAWGVDIDYPDFSDLSGLTLALEAQQLDNKLRLVSGLGYGYAYLSDPINVSAGYSTQFSFQITNLIGDGADWLWFTVSRTPFNEILDTADWVVNVEIDIFNNGARDNNDGNHIGLNYDANWIVVQPVTPSFKNGEVWNVWIDYDGSVMNIYASMDSVKPLTPYISHTVHVVDKIGAPEAYIGFYAGAGGYGADFDILRWSFTTPLPVPITIDIKPGVDPNTINLGSKGSVPVAILTTDDFDALTVDPVTVTFAKAAPSKSRMVDVDSDGDIDMLLYFATQSLNLDVNSTEAILAGETYDGVNISGTDSVTIVTKGKK